MTQTAPFYRRHKILLLCCVVFSLLLFGCRKEEGAFDFKEKDKQPDATGKDTAISVIARLNGNMYRAIGRAMPPADSLFFSFFHADSGSFLEIKLGADTPGEYTLGKSVSKHTAVYYRSALDRGIKGFTSRAKEEAGGKVTISDVDTVNHRVKGSFELLLLSRTSPDSYEFKEGSFNVLYNHAVMKKGAERMNAVPLPDGLNFGTAVAPTPYALMVLPGGRTLRISFNDYKGPGTYHLADQLNIVLRDNSQGKEYTATSAEVALVRFNYNEFLQLLFSCELKAPDGETLTISDGTFVMGR